MQSSGVRYHKSAENLGDDDMDVKVRPSTVGHCRFTVLERVLMVVVCVLLVVAIVIGVLYGTAKANGGTQRSKQEKLKQNNACLTADCVKVSADILRTVDWTANPCNDFYKFSCGKWVESNEIPSSSSSFGQFMKLGKENNKFMRAKLENKKALEKYKKSSAVSKALRDYFSCMEAEKGEESLGFQPVHNLIKQYGSWNITDPNWGDSKWELMTNLVNIHRNISIMPLFIPSVREDLKNSSNNIMNIYPVRSWFMTRDNYLQNSTYHLMRQTAYKNLMLSVITKLANTTKDDPDISRQVEDIYNIERRLNEISMPPEQARKVEEHYKKVTIKELQQYTGKTFNWLDYFQRIFQEVNVDITEKTLVAVTDFNYFRNMSTILGSTNDVVLGNYVTWTVICGVKSYLSKKLRDEFQEYFKKVSGVRAEFSRWQTCLSWTEQYLGLPLSMLYLEEKFGENQMKQVEEMVSGIRKVFINNLQNISWMDDETKKMALKKARSINENIGYPKTLLDEEKLNKKYEELEIDDKDHFGNVLRKRKFRVKKNLEKILQPVNRSEWSLNPVAVNAAYSPTENKIVFPAGVLQSPFFDARRPKSLNYGAIGMVIGHELTHSFDNRGRRYDEHGNLVDWWEPSSVHEFESRTECLVKKYSSYRFHTFKVNGKNTLDENIADNGGIKLAFQAYKNWTEINGEELQLPAVNLTHDQLFFVGFSQVWCAKHRQSVIQRIVQMNHHAPEMIRVLGSLSNFPEFSKAFQCPLGSRMNPRDKCNLW